MPAKAHRFHGVATHLSSSRSGEQRSNHLRDIPPRADVIARARFLAEASEGRARGRGS